MSEPRSPQPQNSRRILQLLGIAIICFLVAIFLQRKGGAYASEFGGHPDEAAHYVTGLMIHDYVAAGFPGSPLNFAKDYYTHYPKVALGNWPPGFYVAQTAWALIFSPGRPEMLALMALLAAFTATLLFHLLKKEFGFWAGAVGALIFLLLPLAQRHTAMIMTEIPMAFLTLLAVLFLSRFIERERSVDSICFGIFASAAILTKGSGLFLALVPPLAILFTRKFHLLKRPAFWAAAIIVLVLCGPWTWKFRDVARAGWMEDSLSWNFTRRALVFYPVKLFMSVGLALSFFALAGVISKLKGQKTEPVGRWETFAAALFALLAFHAIIPAGLEDRHLVPICAIVILFAFAGMQVVAQFIERKRPSLTLIFPGLVGIALFGFFAGVFRIPEKGYQGFGEAATELLNNDKSGREEFLVSSDARGEGMFISELAMREKRPGHIVQRGSKLLASSSWSGSGYLAKFQDKRALADFLRQAGIDYIIVDSSFPEHYRREHHELLQRTVQAFPDIFLRQAEYPIQRETVWTNGITVYRVKPKTS